ncbi:MAG: LTA synthase family protein [Colwellia sp.]|nr:LTA synthase family protein [Colwellia sp.]
MFLIDADLQITTQPQENNQLANAAISTNSTLAKIKAALGPLWVTAVFFIVALAILSAFRLGLVIWQADRVNNINDFFSIMNSGIRVDISSLCYLFMVPILISLCVYVSNKGKALLQRFLMLWCILSMSLLVYLEVITPTFILEYDFRPNRLLIEYLIYPKEVFSMLWTGYKLEILISLSALIITIISAAKLFKLSWLAKANITVKYRVLISIAVILIVFLGARSSIGHRPLNPAMVFFSTDHLLNDLILNSSYSVAFAVKQMGLENSSEKYYGKMEQGKIIDIVRQNTLSDSKDFTNDNFPTQVMHQASYSGKPKNLVILLQESLGARYVGHLGGLPLTPNLDKLMTQGWNFSNLYATGTRSVRGIEAVITGFTPTPSRSVVKLDKSQREFFTIAKLLNENDYHTQFIYGGESHFDNMKSFFLGNGFTDIVDLVDFEKVDFEGSWGASDEDLYDQAHLEFEKLHKQKAPFFSLVFTSSNHTPFEYPDGKITQYDQKKNTRNNAAKYSDYALGQFIKKAKKSSYWQDTIFLVVADHDSRVGGASLVPIDHFRIPGVIFGESIKAKPDDRLVSQIDLAPTLLSLIGVSGYTPMLGHDLTKNIPLSKQRAMMQYDKTFAYMTPDAVTILQPGKDARAFNYQNKQFTERPITKSMSDQAKAHVLFGSLAYKNQWYQ